MKILIIAAAAILVLGACNPNPTNPTNPTNSLTKTPETFQELMEGIQQLGEDVEYTISSDSTGYSEYYWAHVVYRYPEDIKEAFSSSSEADHVIEQQAMIDDYLKTNAKALVDKYSSTAVKCYQYDTHTEAHDTTQYIIALKQLVDSVPDWAKEGNFSENYLYYPEFFSYQHYKEGATQDFTFLNYRHETKVANKTKTTAEETRQLVLDFIAQQKDVKQKARKYTIDEGFATGDDDYAAVSFERGMNKTDSMLVNATHYIIPVHGAERAEVAHELWELFANHVKNHYATVHGFWGFECAKDFDITEDVGWSAQVMQLTFAKDDDKTLHFQVGCDDRGLHILMMNIETRRFYIPFNWLKLASIHNNEYVEDNEFGK